MTTVEHQRTVFESKNKTITIYESKYHGEQCFAVVHIPTDHTELIDYNDGVLTAITKRINRTKALTCDKKKRGGILKFPANGKERSISLRLFAYAKYNGLSLKQVRSKNIELDDDSAVIDNIQDLRSCNLYDAGEIRPHTQSRDIQIVERPGTQEKYIAIKFHNRENGKIEYTDYFPELYEMLARSTYCNLGYNAHNDRATVVVHYANSNDGYTLDNLSKFALIYYIHFERYKNMTGAIKRFIHDYKKLSEKYSNLDVAHINSCKWNNCAANLMFMGTGLNQGMRNWIKLFSAPYRVFTAVNQNNETLIEFSYGDHYTKYYLCESPDDYLDWQRVFLGKALTKRLQLATYITTDGVQQVLTPCGMLAAGEVDRETAAQNEPDLWTWLEHRDKLLSMEQENYITWQKKTGQLTIHAPDSAVDGRPFVLPLGDTCAVVRISPV